MRRLLCAALLLAPVCGCGQAAPTGELSGKVTYQGKPVVTGSVAVMGEDGRFFTAMFRDGAYTLVAPVGPCKLSVTGSDPAKMPQLSPGEYAAKKKAAEKKGDAAMAAFEEQLKNPTALPDKYGSFESSGLSVVVKPGKQIYNIELEAVTREAEPDGDKADKDKK
jgi:hypothetical protein